MQTIIEFIQNHAVLLAAIGVDIINMLIAFVPGFESNSIIHWIWQQLSAIAKPKS